MKTSKIYAGGIMVIMLVLLGFAGAALATKAAGNPHRVIVTFDEAINENARAGLMRAGQVIKELPMVNGAVIILPNQAAVHNVQALSGVTRVETDAVVHAMAPPGACTPWPACKDNEEPEPPPPPQDIEWGVDRIDADLAWTVSRGTGVKVAIIDTGIDQDHPDLTANLKGGVNFTSKNPRKPADPNKWDDDNGHGTHVAGIVAAADNDIGVVGVAPEAQLYAVKVLDRTGSGYVSDIIASLEWSVANGMDVVNMSLSTISDIQALHDAVDSAEASGLILVAAAGNSGDGNAATNEIEYPAKYSSVIAVAATDSSDGTPYWSAEGAEVELAAPGVGINSTLAGGGYDLMSGTSMASPHVAGVVALLLGSGTASSDVRAAMTSTADDLGAVGHDNLYGYGLVDAEEAVTGSQTNP